MTTPKQSYKGPQKKVGEELDWTSQASGYVKRKTGKIVAIVKAGEDAHAALRKVGETVAPRRVTGRRVSAQDRYLVKVTVGNFPSQFYLPGCKAIDRGIAAGKKPEDVKRPPMKKAA